MNRSTDPPGAAGTCFVLFQDGPQALRKEDTVRISLERPLAAASCGWLRYNQEVVKKHKQQTKIDG
jgi:hypothetical protein